MPMTHRALAAVWLAPALLVTACGASAADPAPPPSRSSSVEPETTANPTSPLTARFDGPATVGTGTVRIALVVERHMALPVPLSVTLRAPPGARLVQPSADVLLAPNPAARVDRIELVLEIGSIPPTDLVATLDAQHSTMGIHAEVAYRFGRPEPVVADPPLASHDLVIGGHNLGRPVVVPPQ